MTAQPPGRVVVAPSLLAADFGRLREEVASVTQAGADWLHFDIMDGHFVPNISFGPLVLAALRPHSGLPFDVHLMITPTDPYVAAFAEAGADHILIHPESGPHPHRTLQLIRSLGKKAGVVLNPGTPIESIAWLLELADIVLVMSVNPGFGGQRFLPSQLPKIAALRRMIDGAARRDADDPGGGDARLDAGGWPAIGRSIALAVDGGITPETAAAVRAAGADTLIAGTAVFAAPDRAAAIAALRGGAPANNAFGGDTVADAASGDEAAGGNVPEGNGPRGGTNPSAGL
jgi:ribulose-phosphate 3-epimerase